jgi:tetratricopeptide (TPR) repeat protein
MSRIFISHSNANNAAAIALGEWLAEQGFNDVFLDIDPNRGLAPGERWQEALKAAADRCEAVLFLVSPAWLRSKWCLAEFLLAKSLHKRIFGLIIEPVPFDQLPVEMTAEWQLCELVGEDRFRSFDVEVLGRAQRVEFREAGLDLLRRGLKRAGLDARTFPWPPPAEMHRDPYRGLEPLEPQDAAIFFGRDAWIVRGLDRIRELAENGLEKLLVILGASGSGKSSFLRAGLWPRLARDDMNFLPLSVIRPRSAAISGASGLAVALVDTLGRLGSPRSLGAVKETLATGVDSFGALLDEISGLGRRRLIRLDEATANPTIVLPVDQAEELFQPDGAEEAEALLQMMVAALAPARRLVVIATIRSDRYELLQNEPRIAKINQALFNLPPLPLSEFRGVIEGPAHRVVEAGGRLAIDPVLIERLIADAQGADALPLLGFTLQRLHRDYGSTGRLTFAQYEALGGVQGSIDAAVSAALAEPGRVPTIPSTREAQLAVLRAAFIPWLARIDIGSGSPMRRVAQLTEIPVSSRPVIQRLVEARLLVADHRSGAEVIEVAHESLLRQWPALTAWLAADAVDLQLVEGIERATGEWDHNGRQAAWLDHRDDRLTAAERLTAREDFRDRLGDKGTAYLAACRSHQQDEQSRSQRLHRRIFIATVSAAVVFFAAFLVSGWLYYRADNARHEATQQRSLALFTSDAMSRISGSGSNEAVRLSAIASAVAGSPSVVEQVRAYLKFAKHYDEAWDPERASDALDRANQLIADLQVTDADKKNVSLLKGNSHEIAGDIKWGDTLGGTAPPFKASISEYKASLAALAGGEAAAADRVRVKCKLARAVMFEGRREEAEAELAEAEASLPANSRSLDRALIDDAQADLLLQRSNAEQAAAKLADAIAILRELLEAEHGNNAVRVQLAGELEKSGDLQRQLKNSNAMDLYLAATSLFNKLAEDNPTSFIAATGLDLTRHDIRLLDKTAEADSVENRKANDLAAAVDRDFSLGIGPYRFGMTIQDVNRLLQPPYAEDALKQLPRAWEYHSSKVIYFWRWLRELPDFNVFAKDAACLAAESYGLFMFHDERLFRIVIRILNNDNKCVARQQFIDDFAAKYGLTVLGSNEERRIRYKDSKLAISGFTGPNSVSLDFIQR